MLKRLSLTFILFLFTPYIFSQSIQWQNTIGGDGYDEASTIISTSDGGYLIGGTSGSGISGDKSEANYGNQDYWVVKTDASGTVQWEKTFGGSGQDILHDVIEISTGGYLIGGKSSSPISGNKTVNTQGGYDYWILKVDNTGAIQWQNSYGGNGQDRFASFQETNDGGFILGGHSTTGVNGDKTEAAIGIYDYWIVKIDAAGIIDWDNTIGGDGIEFMNTVFQTTDNGYFIGGYSNSSAVGDKSENVIGDYDYWVVKTDVNGTIVWENTIGGTLEESFSDAIQTSDGGYLIGGNSNSGISGDKSETSVAEDIWIVKLNNTGVIQWQNTIGGNSSDQLSKLEELASGGYILAAHSSSDSTTDKDDDNFGGEDYWAIKIDNTGGIEWNQTLGANADDQVSDIVVTASETFVLVGTSYSDANFDKTENAIGSADFWVFEIDCIAPALPVLSATDLAVCPSVSGTNVTLSIQSGSFNDADNWVWYEASCGGTQLGTGNSIDVIPSSTSTYFVRGEGGCITTPASCSDITITVGTDIVPSSVADSVTCFGGNDGAIDLSISGGTSPFTFDWSDDGIGDNDDTEDLSGLLPGIYTVYITDDIGCVDTLIDTVSEPNNFNININPLDEYNGNDGAIAVSVLGGTPPYTYMWTGPGGFSSTNRNIYNLVAGIYEITITDANGCSTTVNVLLNSQVSIQEQITSQIKIYPNPNTGQFNMSIPKELIGSSYQIIDPAGRIVHQQTVNSTSEFVNLNSVESGVYFMVIQSKEYQFTIRFSVQ